MERAFPGLRLGWRISETGQFIPLPQRDATVAQERPNGGFPLLSNGNESALVTVTGWESPAGISPGGQAQLEVHARLPLTPARRLPHGCPGASARPSEWEERGRRTVKVEPLPGLLSTWMLPPCISTIPGKVSGNSYGHWAPFSPEANTLDAAPGTSLPSALVAMPYRSLPSLPA
jgi:hypothetical protein